MSRDDRKSSIVAAGLISASLFGAPFTLSAPPVHAASSLKAELALMKQATPSTSLSSSSAEKEAAVMVNTPTARKAGKVASESRGGGDSRAAASAAVREAMVGANSKNTPAVKERTKEPPAATTATATATSTTANTIKNSKKSIARTTLEERSKKSAAEQAIDKVVEASEASKDRLQQVIKSDIPRAREGLRTAKSERRSLESKIARLESEKKALKKNNNNNNNKNKKSSSSTAAVEKVLGSELSELRKSLSSAKAGVDAYGKAVERGESEMFKLRRELVRQGGQVKDMREKLKAKTVAKSKSDASKRLKASQVALREATSEADSAMSTLKRSKTKSAGLDASLRASRKAEATQVKTVNRVRGALQKEIDALEREQVRIVGLSEEMSSLNIDIAAQEAKAKSRSESLSNAKAGLKAAESSFRSFK
jgi:chromosome segregation ATPase